MIFLTIAGVLVALAIVTAIGTRMIDRANPPAGRFVDVDGGRLHIVELGDAAAPPVVLLHGASGNLGDMRLALGERLAARYHVILVDRPGHGWSDRLEGRADASPARQAALTHQALSYLGITLPIVLGHSWSGALAMAYALAYSDGIKGLVLLGPVAYPWRGGVGWINDLVTTPVIGPLVAHTLILPIGYLALPAGVRAVFKPQAPPADYIERTGAMMILRPSEFIANAQDLIDLKAFVAEQAPRYGEIKAPVTIIAGDADTIVSPVIQSRALAAALPHATLQMPPDVGHMVHYADPDLVAQVIEKIATVQSR
jgi:pimeloyl-ACP methyl ester carboxylesterase